MAGGVGAGVAVGLVREEGRVKWLIKSPIGDEPETDGWNSFVEGGLGWERSAKPSLRRMAIYPKLTVGLLGAKGPVAGADKSCRILTIEFCLLKTYGGDWWKLRLELGMCRRLFEKMCG